MFKTLSLLLCFSLPLLAKTNMTEMQEFYYKLGQKEAKVKYMQAGYQMALNDFTGLVTEYRKEVEAQQAAKYLNEKHKLTYPKIYKKRKGNSYEIVIKPSKIEGSFSVEDLFIIPLVKKGRSHFQNTTPITVTPNHVASSTNTRPTPKNTKNSSSKRENSFALPDLNKYSAKKVRPSKVSAIQQKSTLYIPYKSASVESTLRAFGSKYSETDKGYLITFAQKKEREKFCFDLTKDKSCKKLQQ